jgi:hypothetical protein
MLPVMRRCRQPLTTPDSRRTICMGAIRHDRTERSGTKRDAQDIRFRCHRPGLCAVGVHCGRTEHDGSGRLPRWVGGLPDSERCRPWCRMCGWPPCLGLCPHRARSEHEALIEQPPITAHMGDALAISGDRTIGGVIRLDFGLACGGDPPARWRHDRQDR